MPRPGDLPEGLLRNLARKNALEISDRRFDDDVERLMRMLEKVLTGAEARAQLPEPFQRLNVRPEPVVVPQVEPKERASVAPTSKFNGLYFSKDHEWIKVEGNVGTVGISNHAQEQLGDIVYIDLPRKGESIAAHDSFGAVESVKAVSELFCPVSGEIIEINDDLNDAPERVNQSPYEDGWMIKVRMNNPADLETLLTRAEYDDFTRMESY
jgi:glycine cleavage system H protein